ncbi:MAG: hypothetical protein HY764_03215 [Candidatus Portnoybacteria bacterium]|nr:hypothetical protein [Candidatus Portnoybacteria bacterium]
MKKLFIKLATIIVLFSISAPALACFGGFYDNFSGNRLDLNKWNVAIPGGNIHVNKGVLVLSVDGRDQFPLIESKINPFPTSGNFAFVMRFVYSKSDLHGSGMSAGSNNVFGVWHDSNHAINFIHNGNLGVFSIPYDNKFHIYKVVYKNGHYYYYLDGKLRYDADSAEVPASILMGYNDFRVDDSWTSFEVDYIKIKPIK